MKNLAALICVLAAACGGSSYSSDEGDFTSDVATLLVLDFDGQVVAASTTSAAAAVRGQMFYTVGHINAEPGVSRLDKLKLTNVRTTALGNGLARIDYHASLPVAWGSKTALPASYTLTLPKRADAAGLQAFFTKYGPACTDPEGHQLTIDNAWYYYRPGTPGCTLAPADVMVARATAQVSTLNTVAKYPEYNKVWEDGQLRVVAVFGKYEAGATSNDDAGIAAYNEFAAAIGQELGVWPQGVPTLPGAAFPDITFKSAKATVTLLLSDEVKSASLAWQKRYASLTPGADVILYNGHAGLGSNEAALARMGNFFPGKYQIMFIDGCDTFAYADDTLANRRAGLNPDDVAGTKYLDLVTNAMPAYFGSMSDASMALVHALLHPEAPLTYPQIFRSVNEAHVVVATGEEDNVFRPGLAVTPRWNALHEEGFVGKSESVQYTVDLGAGTYVFATTPDAAIAGGDADLRVRVGAAPPLTAAYKCQSYVANSNERCKLTLTAPAKVYMTVTGDALGVQSHFELRGWSL